MCAAQDAGGGTTFTKVVAAGVADYIHRQLSRDISLNELASLVGLSPHYFVQIFKNTFRMTPHRYLLRERIEEAKRLLGGDHGSIGEIGFGLGFSDQSHFTRTFRRLTGTTPRRYRVKSACTLRNAADLRRTRELPPRYDPSDLCGSSAPEIPATHSPSRDDSSRV